MEEFLVYGKPNCVYCSKAITLLKNQEHKYTYVDLTLDTTSMSFIKGMGHTSVPQIYQSGNHIGGYDELKQLLS